MRSIKVNRKLDLSPRSFAGAEAMVGAVQASMMADDAPAIAFDQKVIAMNRWVSEHFDTLAPDAIAQMLVFGKSREEVGV